MKIHTARLLDRHDATGQLVIRAQTDVGCCIDITVREQDRAEAASIWGNGVVSYVYRGGKAQFVSRDTEAL